MFPTSLLLLVALCSCPELPGKLSHKTHRGFPRTHPPAASCFLQVLIMCFCTGVLPTKHRAHIYHFRQLFHPGFSPKRTTGKKQQKEVVVVVERWKQSLKSIEKLPSSAGKVFKLSHARITLYVRRTPSFPSAPSTPETEGLWLTGWCLNSVPMEGGCL